MAKFEASFSGDFDEMLTAIHQGILSGSISATFEDGSEFHLGDVSVGVRVYERYSFWGKNRVSLNVTLIAKGDALTLSAIASGGSQALFFKINTIGEEAFLSRLKEVLMATGRRFQIKE